MRSLALTFVRGTLGATAVMVLADNAQEFLIAWVLLGSALIVGDYIAVDPA